GVDPAEVRRKNLLPTFTEPHTTAFGAVYDSGDYVTALDKALGAAGYEDLRREQAKRRADGDEVQIGIGLSCYVEITGAGGEAGGAKGDATREVHSDGGATILTGTSPHGQGHQTVWAMLASEELGIPVDRITLKWGDTDLIPEGGGTGGSRRLAAGGGPGPAARAACSRAGPRSSRPPATCSTWPGSGPPTNWRRRRRTSSSTLRGARSRWAATRKPPAPWPRRAGENRRFSA